MQQAKEAASVCIVRHSYYPSELNVKREAEALLKECMRVSVICLRDEGQSAKELVNGVDVHRLPLSHKRGKMLRYIFEYNAFFLLACIRLIFLHLKYRFKVIQVNTMPDALVFVALLPKLLGARVILHMHEPMPELFSAMFTKKYHRPFICVIKIAEKWSLKFADRVLTVTREIRQRFGERGADVNKITVVVNVPDDELFNPERFKDLREQVAQIKKEERRKGIYRILSHGAIEERYGFDLIVKAVATLKSEMPGIQFRFMGKGDYLDEVIRLGRALGIEGIVNYLGFVPFEEMVKEILAADVCIVPVKKNPYSTLVHTNKIYEYIALGKPVIASRLDSMHSYFPEDTISYFEPDKAEDLARAIRYIYSHPDEVVKRMMRAKEIYETYRWDRERKKYLGVYRALLKEGTVRK